MKYKFLTGIIIMAILTVFSFNICKAENDEPDIKFEVSYEDNGNIIITVEGENLTYFGADFYYNSSDIELVENGITGENGWKALFEDDRLEFVAPENLQDFSKKIIAKLEFSVETDETNVKSDISFNNVQMNNKNNTSVTMDDFENSLRINQTGESYSEPEPDQESDPQPDPEPEDETPGSGDGQSSEPQEFEGDEGEEENNNFDEDFDPNTNSDDLQDIEIGGGEESVENGKNDNLEGTVIVDGIEDGTTLVIGDSEDVTTIVTGDDKNDNLEGTVDINDSEKEITLVIDDDKKDENQSKEANKENNDKNQKEQDNLANKKIPQTGATIVIVPGIIISVCVVIAVICFKKYKEIK